MPATAKLLATIATLPHGAVVLPGLDTDLDEAAWELIGGIKDGDRVVPPPPAIRSLRCMRCCGASASRATRSSRSAQAGARDVLVSEAMRPSGATERWAERIDAATRDAALADVSP